MHSQTNHLPRRVLVLVAIASLAALIIASRAALGPFRLPVLHAMVNSPFVAESAFWFAILGLIWTRVETSEAAPVQSQAPTAFPISSLACVLGLTALAFARNLGDPFLSDDYIILSGPPFHWGTFLAALHRAGGDGSYRPLGTVYYQALLAWGAGSAIVWHTAGLALHLVNVALVFVIAWRLWNSALPAATAAAVFGLHGTRPEAALWSAGNCDLLACACVLGALALALSNENAPRAWRTPVALLLLAAAILFKESAYAMPLIAVCILAPRRRGFLAACFAISGALFLWRWSLFHGPGGYVDPATGRPAILSLHPVTALKAVFVRVWTILFTPVNWDAPAVWWLPCAILAALFGLLWLAASSRAGRAVRQTRFRLLAATCCAVLPAIHLAAIGQSALGSRVLYLPCAPFALLVASFVPPLEALTSAKVKAAVALLIVGTAGILEHNLSAWHEAANKAEALCHAAQPGSSAPGTFNGVVLFQNGFAQCVAAARQRN